MNEAVQAAGKIEPVAQAVTAAVMFRHQKPTRATLDPALASASSGNIR
jgi:hypothetical protein